MEGLLFFTDICYYIPPIQKKFQTKPKFFCIFVPHWFTRQFPLLVMKRESGENPEQSRCCKLILIDYLFSVKKTY